MSIFSFKYLICDRAFPVLWDIPDISHKLMAKFLEEEGKKATSAGTVLIVENGLHCGGGSQTLNMETGVYDEEIISRYFGNNREAS